MKVAITPHAKEHIPVSQLYGNISFASFDRIVLAMEQTGELRLMPNEYVEAVDIHENGLSFVISSK